MKRLSLLLLVTAWFVTGCQKEVSIDNPGNNGGGGNNGKDTYQPMSKGSYWKVRTTGPFNGEYMMTATDEKRTVNGIDFTVFKNTSPQTQTLDGLWGIKDHNYYTLVKGVSPNTGAPFDLNFRYLNDTASVGFTWEHDAGQGNGFAAKTPGVILEKGITMTVEGKTYKDVIHTRLEMQYEIPPFGMLIAGTYDYYIAKNIGVIRVDTELDPVFGGGVKAVSSLYEYSIK